MAANDLAEAVADRDEAHSDRMRQQWAEYRTSQRERILAALRESGGRICEAAEALGQTASAVQRAVRKLGLAADMAEMRREAAISRTRERSTEGRRSRDRMDCSSYLACLDIAARKDARWVCARGCQRYQPALVVLSVPVRSNWQIESAGVSNRRASEATEEDRREHVRSKEARPLGSQVSMPWRLVG